MDRIEKLFRCRINELVLQGRVRTAKCYESTLKSVMLYSEFRSHRTLDAEFVNGYYHWLRNERGVKRNTISFYMQMPHSDNGYLLPIIKDEHKFYVQYRSFVAVVNRNLKKVALEVGLNIPLTMYVARHSWATIAMSKGIVTPVISRALGHTNERTTRIYLAQLDMTEQIDYANAVVLEELCVKLSKE